MKIFIITKNKEFMDACSSLEAAEAKVIEFEIYCGYFFEFKIEEVVLKD